MGGIMHIYQGARSRGGKNDVYLYGLISLFLWVAKGLMLDTNFVFHLLRSCHLPLFSFSFLFLFLLLDESR